MREVIKKYLPPFIEKKDKYNNQNDDPLTAWIASQLSSKNTLRDGFFLNSCGVPSRPPCIFG